MERKSDLSLPRAGGLDDTIGLTFSSGSTGRPKAIMKTNRNFLAIIAANQNKEISPLTAQDINLTGDLNHSPGLSALFVSIITGAQQAISRVDEDHENTFKAIHEHKITRAFLVPTQLNFLSKNHEKYQAYLKSLKEVQCGGANLSETIFDSIINNFNLDKLRRGKLLLLIDLRVSSHC